MLDYLNLSGKRRLPVILQTEATECGLACLTMIARFHGHDVDLASLRGKYATSLSGATFEALVNISGKLDLGARALRLGLEDLNKLQVPAILHWDLNHFVVLKSVRGSHVIIHDPARGEFKLRMNEVSNHFTGVALELLPTTNFTKQTTRKRMKLSLLWGRLIGLKRAIAQTLILSVILQIIVLASPFYLQLVVDEAVVKFDAKLLFVLAIGFGLLAFINTVTTMMRSWTILYFGHQMSFQMVANVFRHLIHLPTNYFEKRHVGDVISRMGSTEPIQTALTKSVVTAIIDGFMAVITGIIIFLYSPILGVVVVSSIVVLLMFTLIFYPILRRTQEEAILTDAIKETHVIESIKASTTIKLFSAQNQRISAWRNLLADTINSKIKYGKYEIFLTSVQEFITSIQTVIVVYLGATLIMNENSGFTIGMLFAFMAYRSSFTTSASSLMQKVIEFRLLSLHLERIADIVQTETEGDLNDANSVKVVDAQPTSIEFQNVRFRYSESDPWVLNSISFKIEAGEFVTLVGPSGCGKTTILKLMLGLYIPTEGKILIDGQPLTDSMRISWRENIGVVMQNDQLLSGSIADNISFFNSQVQMTDVHNAAQKAYIHEEIMAMPMNYLSFIGDMGSVLSGGQKQRILLARALYRKPKALFLDEGTANIDEQTEKLIVDIISKSDMTRVVVAHRPEFIKRSGRVLKVQRGKLI